MYKKVDGGSKIPNRMCKHGDEDDSMKALDLEDGE